jgi:glycosyltransferase involved in cell wall biosynthesis
MKVALLHDWLNTKVGGGEQVLLELAQMYPEADIYTLVLEPANFRDLLDLKRVHTSRLQRYPKWLRRRSRYLLPFIPKAVDGFDLSSYDLVISSSSAWVKGAITKPETVHICYCFSPMRFAWDSWPRYVDEQAVGPIRRALIHLIMSRIRLWDYYSSKRVDYWVAISETVAARIRKYYQAESVVIYPPVKTSEFSPVPAAEKGNYYVTLSALTPYKKVDLAIAAANLAGIKLTVIGDGNDRARLEKLAGPTITFAGRVSTEERKRLLAQARGLIFPGEEDFGIAPIEALASGTPVIAYRKGGLVETMVDGETAIFFDEPTAEALVASLKIFEQTKFQTANLTARAKAFDETRFRTDFTKYVDNTYANHLT